MRIVLAVALSGPAGHTDPDPRGLLGGISTHATGPCERAIEASRETVAAVPEAESALQQAEVRKLEAINGTVLRFNIVLLKGDSNGKNDQMDGAGTERRTGWLTWKLLGSRGPVACGLPGFRRAPVSFSNGRRRSCRQAVRSRAATTPAEAVRKLNALHPLSGHTFSPREPFLSPRCLIR